MLQDARLVAAYTAAQRDYDTYWRPLDAVLRHVCTEFPGHADRAGVNAKLYLVGRTFASGIERQIKSDGTQGGALRKLGDHLVAHAEGLDPELARLPRTEAPTDDELRTVVEAHGAVVALIKPLLHRGTPRSFVSKYLHFHSPAVPIYDSVAVRNLPPYVTDAEAGSWSGGRPAGDPDYRWYVRRVRHLMRRLQELHVAPTIRLVEWMLSGRPESWATFTDDHGAPAPVGPDTGAAGRMR